MCGIVGFVQKAPAPELLAGMMQDIAHRPPDREGSWQGDGGELFGIEVLEEILHRRIISFPCRPHLGVSHHYFRSK